MLQRVNDLWDFWRFLLQRFIADQGTSNAAALTYTTLFAVVPMMTVTFSMLSAIPAFQGSGEQIHLLYLAVLDFRARCLARCAGVAEVYAAVV